jgi:hypothetical protein
VSISTLTRVPIRAHHLLCLQGFQGLGYSPHFVENFYDVLKSLDADEDAEFEITPHTDAICGACPHQEGEACAKDDEADRRIRDTDARVLQKLRLPPGFSAKASTILDFVNAALKTRSDVSDVCGTCPWNAKCLWYQSREV